MLKKHSLDFYYSDLLISLILVMAVCVLSVQQSLLEMWPRFRETLTPGCFIFTRVSVITVNA